jgi:hypothetical protein
MESTPAPNVIQFPAFDRGLDDGDNVVPFHRSSTERMLEALADDSIERENERARLRAIEADTRRDLRIMRWQSRVKWFAILTAYAAIIFFAWQLGRSAF